MPDRILRAIERPTIDHRGPEFKGLGFEVLEGIKEIFQTKQPVIIYPASGTGAWEAALVNTLSPGDRVLMYDTGHFASIWHKMAMKLSLDAQLLPGSWREGAKPKEIEQALAEDKDHTIKSVCGPQRYRHRHHLGHPGNSQSNRPRRTHRPLLR